MNGTTLIPTTETNAHGACFGVVPVQVAAGASPEVTLVVTQVHSNKDVTLESKLKLVTLESLTVVSNTATQIDATNWAVVKSEANEYVIVQANFGPTNNLVLTNLDVLTAVGGLIQWTNGQSVPGHPFQWMVTKTNSVETTVTASLGSSGKSLNVWVIWATINIRTAGTNPSPLSFPTNDYYAGNQLGIQYGTNSHLVSGKICAIGQITPSGIHSIITNGWFIWQNIMPHEFQNGLRNGPNYTNTWQPDATDNNSATNHETKSPDNNDRIFYVDAPVVNEVVTNSCSSYEMNNNFYVWATWNGQVCSDTTNNVNNLWHWQEWWNASRTPWITFTNLGTNIIDLGLYTNSAY